MRLCDRMILGSNGDTNPRQLDRHALIDWFNPLGGA